MAEIRVGYFVDVVRLVETVRYDKAPLVVYGVFELNTVSLFALRVLYCFRKPLGSSSEKGGTKPHMAGRISSGAS